MRLACVVWLALAAPCWGEPPKLSIPSEVKGDVGDPLRVAADTAGKQVQWLAMDPGLKVFPPELLKDSKTAVVWATAAGRYRLLAYTGLGDEVSLPAVCVVVVGQPTPPPGPDPPPTDPLVQALQAAYKLDADADKAKSAAFLAAVYRGAGALADLPDVKTNADLVARVAAAVHAPGLGLPDAAIPKTRAAVGAYLNAQLGTVANQPVDKAKAKACFAALAQALDTLTR